MSDTIKALVLDWLRGKAIGQLETADDAQLGAMMVHRLAGLPEGQVAR